MDVIFSEIRKRLLGMFSALARGEDVPPGTALRTEGLMEAALLTGHATIDELDALLLDCFNEANPADSELTLEPDWREFYPFPQIPLRMKRAPVYPSTSD